VHTEIREEGFMAIQIFCTGITEKGRVCKTSNRLGAERCSNCGTLFGRDKKYRVCVSIKGKRITRVVDNLTIARETEAAIKGDMVRGEYEINRNVKRIPTLGELWAKYLPWAREHKKTWRNDRYNYDAHLAPRFGKKHLDAISGLDVERLKLELKKSTNKQGKPFSAATIKHQLVLIKRLYNLARRWGLYAGENPVDRVEFPRLDNQRTKFLTDEESDRLMKILDAWPFRESAAFVRLALLTGCRRSELFRLVWDDIDFNQGMITLRGPKGGRTQTIPISPQALEVLRKLERTSPYVFPGKKGGQRTDFKGPWLKIRKAAGLPDSFRFHDLRHNFASAMISNGVGLEIVQALLCHKSFAMTQRYAHLAPGALKEAAQKSGDLLEPKPVKDHAVNLDE
jgi:integrase